MVINTNLPAQTGARLLAESSSLLTKSLQRLSSGSKLNSPEDDAAGMAVSMKFDAQIGRINAARSNLGNAISFSQTQDGFLQKVGKALDRMSELATLAQDVTKSTEDLGQYNLEFTKLRTYIDDLVTKKFNGLTLFAGGGALNVTTDSDGNTFNMTAVDASTFTVAAADVINTTTAAASAALDVKSKIDQLATARANVGANISVLGSYQSQLGVLKDNLSAANSRLRDTDVAEESANFAKYNILVQAGTAMLAQANQQPASVLRLLQ